MRIIAQHLQPIFYAKYEGQTETLEDGLHTGDYVQAYGDVQTANVYISVPKRLNAELERNGVVTPYRRTLISETDLGLAETDLFSYGLAEYDGNVDSSEGGLVNPWDANPSENGGVLLPWTPNGETVYKILRIEKSLHHTTYVIEEL